MAVSAIVRKIEEQIDASLASLPLWHCSRDLLLEGILQLYRDEIEVLFLRMTFAVSAEELGILTALEDRRRAGTFQLLKWAMEFGNPEGFSTPDPLELQRFVEIGAYYEAWVDALKLANYDLASIEADTATHTVFVFEGGERTGQDANLIRQQQFALPFRPPTPFVEDSDQLTKHWTAGDFRGCVRRISLMAEDRETGTITLNDGTNVLPRPVIFEVTNTFTGPSRCVVDDLTLTREKMLADKWRLTCFSELPIIEVGSRRMAASNMVKALARFGDDYMLRIAARTDPDQYSKVSGLREGRMISYGKQILEQKGWRVTPHRRLSNPSREIDIYAERNQIALVLGLRSTLRPESPWEVKKRNDYIVEALDHTASVLPNFSSGAIGVVLTDGYRGDYVTWERAIAIGVAIGVMDDLEDIADDPGSAGTLLKSRVGFHDMATQYEALPEGEYDLFGWHFRFIDAAADRA
jgi:hypothetical protein